MQAESGAATIPIASKFQGIDVSFDAAVGACVASAQPAFSRVRIVTHLRSALMTLLRAYLLLLVGSAPVAEANFAATAVPKATNKSFIDLSNLADQ
jgi:hypothetical protein